MSVGEISVLRPDCHSALALLCLLMKIGSIAVYYTCMCKKKKKKAIETRACQHLENVEENQHIKISYHRRDVQKFKNQ